MVMIDQGGATLDSDRRVVGGTLDDYVLLLPGLGLDTY